MSGPGKLVPGDEALLEGQVPSGPNPESGWVLHLQPQFDGDDQHLEDFRCRRAHPGSDLCRGAPSDPGISVGLPERKEDRQHEVLLRVEGHHHHRGSQVDSESWKRNCQRKGKTNIKIKFEPKGLGD